MTIDFDGRGEWFDIVQAKDRDMVEFTSPGSAAAVGDRVGDGPGEGRRTLIGEGDGELVCSGDDDPDVRTSDTYALAAGGAAGGAAVCAQAGCGKAPAEGRDFFDDEAEEWVFYCEDHPSMEDGWKCWASGPCAGTENAAGAARCVQCNSARPDGDRPVRAKSADAGAKSSDARADGAEMKPGFRGSKTAPRFTLGFVRDALNNKELTERLHIKPTDELIRMDKVGMLLRLAGLGEAKLRQGWVRRRLSRLGCTFSLEHVGNCALLHRNGLIERRARGGDSADERIDCAADGGAAGARRAGSPAQPVAEASVSPAPEPNTAKRRRLQLSP